MVGDRSKKTKKKVRKIKEESSLGTRDKRGRKVHQPDNVLQHWVPLKDYTLLPLNLRDFRRIPLTLNNLNSKKAENSLRAFKAYKGLSTNLMILLTFPIFCWPSALNSYLIPQLLIWIMLRSSFASNFLSISFCKSLSVTVCSFMAFFSLSNLVCPDFGHLAHAVLRSTLLLELLSC